MRIRLLLQPKEPAYIHQINALGERTFKPGTFFAYDEAGHQIGEYTAGVSQGQEVLWLGDLPLAMIQARAGEQALDSPARSGAWQIASEPAGASLGSFYRNDPGTGAATAQWTIPQSVSRAYRLYARWVEAPSHSAAARYTVIHAGGANVISADQRQNGGRWNLLGTFNFTPGANHRVVLTNSPDGAVIADAIKLVPDTLAPSIGNVHTDHLGTPRLIEDHSGKTVWRWDHLDPFGANPANEDPDGDGVKVVFNLRFPGQVFDKETGTHYNYFRDYDPASGRYVQADPIGLEGGVNTYTYAASNPLGFTDPTGQFSLPLLIIGGAALLSAGAVAGYSIVDKFDNVMNLYKTMQRAQQLTADIKKAYEACVCNDQAACRRYVELNEEYRRLVAGATKAGAGISNVPGGGPLPGKIGGAAGQLSKQR